MLIFLVDFLKIVLLSGLVLAVWNLSITRLLMPKIFWLIALFVQLSFLLLLHGIEFIAFVVLLLYVGAISVLFLFVVMILNPDVKREALGGTFIGPSWLNSYYKLTPTLMVFSLSLLMAEAYTLEFFSYLQGLWTALWPFLQQTNLFSAAGVTNGALVYPLTNTLGTNNNDLIGVANYGWGTVTANGLAPHSDLWFIAESFYTQDFVLFWLVGLILLVAMIGAILLTLQKTRGIKRQKGTNQSKRYSVYGR